jgi:hypothetical protein
LLNLDEGLDPAAERDVATAVATKRVMEKEGVKHPLEFARSISASKAFQREPVHWRPFEEAREFARSLGLKSAAKWNVYRSKKSRTTSRRTRTPFTKTMAGIRALRYCLIGFQLLHQISNCFIKFAIASSSVAP